MDKIICDIFIIWSGSPEELQISFTYLKNFQAAIKSTYKSTKNSLFGYLSIQRREQLIGYWSVPYLAS